MGKSSCQKLIELGAETLADLLIEIASDSESANHKVQRAISTPSENVSLFKQKLKEVIGTEGDDQDLYRKDPNYPLSRTRQ